jgi:hypothetical protein
MIIIKVHRYEDKEQLEEKHEEPDLQESKMINQVC